VFRWNILCYCCVINILLFIVVPKDHMARKTVEPNSQTGSTADVGGSRSPATVLSLLSVLLGATFSAQTYRRLLRTP
jgi:hypothetical protein